MDHLRHQAAESRARHEGLRPGNLESFLADRDCVRYPTRLALELGDMNPHQFAQPDRDYRSDDPEARILYLRPVLGKRPDLIALAVSYMIPVLNYGAIITDEHCIEYGSTLMGLDSETYYKRVCDLADFVGAEFRTTDEGEEPAPTSACGCH
jgi:hypothetical protein